MAGQSDISAEQVRKMFDVFDADQSGTIDRSELRLLFFSLGRALNDEQLEAALEEMDADGNGTIEFEDLEAFIRGSPTQKSEARVEHAMAGQSDISAEQVRKMFDVFDADQSGTIDRSELRLLFFSLGRALNDEQLEAALEEMDADGNGTIEFEDLEAFIRGSPTQESGGASAALRFSLRKKLLASQAQEMLNALNLKHKKAVPGSVHVTASCTTGNTFAVPSSQGQASNEQSAPPFKVHLRVGAEDDTTSLSGFGAVEGETEAIQIVFGASPDVARESVQNVQKVLDALLQMLGKVAAAQDERMPVTRVLLEGPMPSPLADDTGDALVASVFLRTGLAKSLAKRLPLDALVDSSAPQGQADGPPTTTDAAPGADDDGGDVGSSPRHRLKQAMKSILQKLEVVIQANHSLQDMHADDVCQAGGSLDVQTSVDAKVSKGVLQALRTVAQQAAYADTSSRGRRNANNTIGKMVLMSAVDTVDTHMHFDAEQLFNLTVAAGLSDDRPALADVSPARFAVFALERLMFQDVLSAMSLQRSPGEGLEVLVQFLSSEGDSTDDLPVPLQPPTEELAAQLASSDDAEEQQGMAMAAAAGILKWFVDSVLDVRSIRATAAGLALDIQTSGLDLQWAKKALMSVHATRAALIAQNAKQRAVPGLLVLASSPQYSAAIRGITCENADSASGIPDHHILHSSLANFNSQFQLTLRDIGAVDYVDVFEYAREEGTHDLAGAFGESREEFLKLASSTLQELKVLPPSGVRGPFGVLVVLPASALAGAGDGAEARQAAAAAALETAKALIAAVQTRVQALNGECPEQPSEAMWSVMVDCQGGAVPAGVADAARQALGLAQVEVTVVDVGSSLGVMAGLSAAVRPVLEACGSQEYIDCRAAGEVSTASPAAPSLASAGESTPAATPNHALSTPESM